MIDPVFQTWTIDINSGFRNLVAGPLLPIYATYRECTIELGASGISAVTPYLEVPHMPGTAIIAP